MPASDKTAQEKPPFRRGTFFMDALDGEFEGYTRGLAWNGWATPFFELEVARRVADESNRVDDGTRVIYDRAADRFVLEDEAYPDDPVEFEPTAITVDGAQIKVYPIGTYYWTWEEHRPRERA